MSESDEMFTEIQDEGMADIGTRVLITVDGKTYKGIINPPETTSQMMSGGYQGRAVIIVRATRDQFATSPAQRSDILLTDSYGQETQWRSKEVAVDESAHYVFTLLKQLPS